MNELLLAIDAGTGSCGRCCSTPTAARWRSASASTPTPREPGVPGSQVFDTAANWELICACIAEAIDLAAVDASAIRAVATTSMREGMVLYDAAAARSGPARTSTPAPGTRPPSSCESGDAEEIYERAGDWVAITAPARLPLDRPAPARRCSPAIAPHRDARRLDPTRLSGEFVTDVSLGSSSGMFDLADRDWSETILEIVGLERVAVAAGARVRARWSARSTAAAAAETGMPAGTPVVAGGADTQLGLLGIGIRADRSTTVVGGSVLAAHGGARPAADRPEARACGRSATPSPARG